MIQEKATRDPVDILEEVDTQSASMGIHKNWVTLRSLTCFATQLRGERLYTYMQLGYKNPWVLLFSETDPGLVENVNRVRVTYQPDGSVHDMLVKSVRRTNGVVIGTLWTVDCDEITNRPRP